MNSWNTLRNAQALVGFRACVRALPLCSLGLSLGQVPDHREYEDPRYPGGRCV